MSHYFSEKFKALRKENDLTQEQAADIFHISPQTVSRWETGANYPDVELLPHIAIYFKVTIDELLGTETLRNEEEVKSSMKDIRNMLNSGKFDAAIDTARKALRKYPMNADLHYLLVQALSIAIVAKPEENDGFKDEIIMISKRIINLADYKSSLHHRVQLIRNYAKWDMKEEAKQLLDTLPAGIWEAREVWLGLILEGEAWVKHTKHSIVRAMYVIESYARDFEQKANLSPQKAIEFRKSFMEIVRLINVGLLDDTSVNHLEVAFDYIIIAELYGTLGDKDNVLCHIELATEHSLMHPTDQMDITNEDDGGNYMPWTTRRNLPWILWEDNLSKPQFDFVRQDERFVKCFEQLKMHSKELR